MTSTLAAITGAYVGDVNASSATDDVINSGAAGSDAVADWAKTSLLAVVLFGLSLMTSIGNAMVLHAVRTDKRLQTVRTYDV